MIEERELRDALRRRADAVGSMPIGPTVAVRRARRRLAMTASVSLITVAALVAGVVIGVARLTVAHRPVPASEPAQWTRVQLDQSAAMSGADPHAVAAGPSGYVAVGDISMATSGTGPQDPNLRAPNYQRFLGKTSSVAHTPVWTSPDWTHWTPVPPAGAPDSLGLGNVAYGHGLFVTVGNTGSLYDANPPDNAAWFSSDGVSWTQATIHAPDHPAWAPIRLFDVMATNFGFLVSGAIGDNGFVWQSADGRVWDPVSNESVFGGSTFRQQVQTLALGGPGYLAFGGEWRSDAGLGATPLLWTSTDGTSWTRQTFDPNPLPFEAIDGGVTTDGPRLVAAGEAGSTASTAAAVVWTSTDGVTWTRQDFPSSSYLFTVTYADGRYFIGGDGGIWTSGDGLAWTHVPDPNGAFTPDTSAFARQGAYVEAFADGPNGLIATGTVGLDGTVWVGR